MRHPVIYADSELCTAGDKRQIFSQSIPENGCSVKESPIPEDSGITELFDLPDERGIFAYAIKLLKISGYILCLIHAELPI